MMFRHSFVLYSPRSAFLIFTVSVCSVFGFTANAQAALIQANYEGIVSQVVSGGTVSNTWGYQVGDAVSGVMTIDTELVTSASSTAQQATYSSDNHGFITSDPNHHAGLNQPADSVRITNFASLNSIVITDERRNSSPLARERMRLNVAATADIVSGIELSDLVGLTFNAADFTSPGQSFGGQIVYQAAINEFLSRNDVVNFDLSRLTFSNPTANVSEPGSLGLIVLSLLGLLQLRKSA